MKQVHIRVEDELYDKLNAYSLQSEQSMQDCVREAVAYYVCLLYTSDAADD